MITRQKINTYLEKLANTAHDGLSVCWHCNKTVNMHLTSLEDSIKIYYSNVAFSNQITTLVIVFHRNCFENIAGEEYTLDKDLGAHSIPMRWR